MVGERVEERGLARVVERHAKGCKYAAINGILMGRVGVDLDWFLHEALKLVTLDLCLTKFLRPPLGPF